MEFERPGLLQAGGQETGDPLLYMGLGEQSEEGLLGRGEPGDVRQPAVLIEGLFGQRDRRPVERRHPPRPAVDEGLELVVGDGTVDPAVPLGGVGIEILCGRDDFQRTRAPGAQ